MPNPIYPPGVVNPKTDPAVDPTDPFGPNGSFPQPVLIPPGTKPGSVVINTGGMQPGLPSALKWLGALALLWIILTALTEYSPNTKQIGIGLAGLILVGALYYLGPDKPDGTPGAISNIKHLWE